MIRYHIFEGDVTTAGGVVQKHTQGASTFKWHGRLASNIGDKINCPACGSVGYIQAAGMRRPFDNMNHVPALNNDLCICKCNPPPKLKHSQTTCNQNVEGGIIWDNSKTTIKKTINSYFPNSQQNLNNSLVADKDESYYKWWWGELLSNNPKTIAQEKNTFSENFDLMHNEYAYGKVHRKYEIDPKAWDGEVAFVDLPKVIQASADTSHYTLAKALASLSVGQSTKVVLRGLTFGRDYVYTVTTKQWPHGRWACDAIGTLTKLGTDARGRPDFQFTGYLEIRPDLYSWTLDNWGFKNLGIAFMGAAVKMATGKKTPAPVYTTPDPKKSGLPTSYMRHFYFDYKKKGVKLPLIGI